MIYAVAAAYPVGCTFLDWSVQWLSGATDLCVDPITMHNAHGHAKNHPCGLDQTLETIQLLRRSQTAVGLYPYTHDADWHAAQLGFDITQLTQPQWQQIHDCQAQELRQILDACQDHGIRTIYVNVRPKWHLYFLRPRKISPWLSHHSDWSEALSQRNQIDPALPIWDRRERLALDIRPWHRAFDGVYIDRARPHIWLEAEDIWFDAAQRMPEILGELELTVDPDRWHHWQHTWNKWQQIQLQHLRFVWQLPSMLDAILNGWCQNLPTMHVIEEAVIQHCLIYAHDINIRNWQLQQFPNSARDLYHLLEPNTHPVIDIHYRDLLRRSIDSLRSSM